MSKFLEDLWYSYQMENVSRNTPEEQSILHQIVMAEELLLGELTTEQKVLLEEFLSLSGQLHSLYEKKAFFHGIRFTMRFITEALRPDPNDTL